MEFDVNELIQAEVKRLNDLFQIAAKISGKRIKPFAIKDYTYLKESQKYFGMFTVPYFLTYAVFKDIEFRILNPYPGTIWYWKKDVDSNKTKDFLPTQSRLLYDTLNSYMRLLKAENQLQALVLFRSYIEYSSQLYASLLDFEFFKKYAGLKLMDEDYKQLWFNSLKPAKVLSRIKSIHSEINQLIKENKIVHLGNPIYRLLFKPFDSDLRGLLYGSLSELSHGSYLTLIKRDQTDLYALVWLCTTYLVESYALIDELTSIYFKYSTKELFKKWITIEIYLKSMEPKALLFVKE